MAIERYRAGQRVNIPRHMERQRTSVVNNITIFTPSRPQGGHHHCCCGGGSGFDRFLAGFTACMGVFGGFFGGLFGRGNAQLTQQTYVDPTASFGLGYNTGLYGSSYNPFGSTYTPLAGNVSAAQGADSSSRTQAQKELDSMNKNKKYSYTNGKIPSVTDDGKYKYGDKTYDTISDLETAIEEDQQPADPVTKDGETVKKDEGQGGPDPTEETKKDQKTYYTNEYNINTGFSYSNGTVTIKDKNVPEIVTLSAFILNDNNDSTISLRNKKWEDNFKLIAGEAGTMTEVQFTEWFENYAKEAKTAKSPRKATDTFEMTESDSTFIKQLYKAMSNNGQTLSAEQFKNFMEGFFNDENYKKDGSFSRKEFAEYVNEKLEALQSS